MKHTKESLTAMSDFEVNKVLACSVGMDCVWRDYCNNPSDIMPLVFEHGVSLSCREILDDWLAHTALADYQDTNPLRAAACCLILVLQEKE